MDENQNQEQINNTDGSNNPVGFLKTIHTYTSDMADAIRTNETSVIKIALAEKEKRQEEAEYKKAEGTGMSKFLLVLGGVVLVGIAIFAFYFVIKQKENNNIVVDQTPGTTVIPSILSTDESISIDITNAQNQNDIADLIKNQVTVGKTGSIKEIVLTENITGRAQKVPILDLLAKMKFSAPQALVRTIDDPYMVGVYTLAAGTNLEPHLFIILEVKDYNQAYRAMLDWEPTLLHDMFTIFHVDVSADRASLLTKEWKDITINNQDGRILYDTYGDDVLYYIFPDKNNLIITDSKDAIREIDARLLTKTIKPL